MFKKLFTYTGFVWGCVASLGMASLWQAHDEFEFLRLATEEVFRDTRSRHGDGMTVLTFGMDPVMRVRFPSVLQHDCTVDVHYVAEGAPGVSAQLSDLWIKDPTMSPSAAGSLVKIAYDSRALSCNSALVSLLRQGQTLALPFDVPPDPETLYFGDFSRIERSSAPLHFSASFPYAWRNPVAAWMREVRQAVLRYIEAGFQP